VSVKDRAVLALMASLELCTYRMSGFIGPYKPSSFLTTMSKRTSLLHVVLLLFGGRMRPMGKTSSQEQGSNFNIVGTCEWLSYVRASGSQAYGVLVRFFPLKGVYRLESPRHSQL
jgi:hypothetical protein